MQRRPQRSAAPKLPASSQGDWCSSPPNAKPRCSGRNSASVRMAIPDATLAPAEDIATLSTCRREAPSAMRMPNSLVLCTTEYESTLNSPIAHRNNATIENPAKSAEYAPLAHTGSFLIHVSRSAITPYDCWSGIHRCQLLSNAVENRSRRVTCPHQHLRHGPHDDTVGRIDCRSYRVVYPIVQRVAHHADHLHPAVCAWRSQCAIGAGIESGSLIAWPTMSP